MDGLGPGRATTMTNTNLKVNNKDTTRTTEQSQTRADPPPDAMTHLFRASQSPRVAHAGTTPSRTVPTSEGGWDTEGVTVRNFPESYAETHCDLAWRPPPEPHPAIPDFAAVLQQIRHVRWLDWILFWKLDFVKDGVP